MKNTIRNMSVILMMFFILTLANCGDDDNSGVKDVPPTDPEITVAVIDSYGGTVTDDSGLSVTFPSGAVSKPTEITIDNHNDSSSLSQAMGEPWLSYLAGATFGPEGLAFNEPVTITFSLAENQVPGEKLDVYVYNSEKSAWQGTGFVAIVSDDGLSASAQVVHFSEYIIMGSDSRLVEQFESGFFEPCNPQPTAELVDQLIQRVSTQLFPLNEKKPWDYSAALSQRNYGCYEVTGHQFVVQTSRAMKDPESGSFVNLEDLTFEPLVGEEGAFALYYYHAGDDNGISPVCGEYQMNYSFDLYVWLSCAQPALSLSEPGIMNIGDVAELDASLICGSAGMEGQSIDFSFIDQSSNFSSVETDSAGQATVNVRPPGNETCADGSTAVKAQYQACKGQELPATVEETTPLQYIYLLTGSWNETEVADERNCDEAAINTYRRTVSVLHDLETDIISGSYSSGFFSGTKEGCAITGWGGESEDAGKTTYSGSGVIAPDGLSVSASGPWSWVCTTPLTCGDTSCSGTSEYSFVRK